MTANKDTDSKGMHIYIQVHILQSYKSSRAPVFVVANVRRVRRERVFIVHFGEFFHFL